MTSIVDPAHLHYVVPRLVQPALKDGKIAELSNAIQVLIAESTKGDDQEWREFAEEMALQYGFTYADDDATTLQARAVDLVNMMAVIGYRKGAQPKLCFMCQGKGWHYAAHAYPPGTTAPETKINCAQCVAQSVKNKA